VDPRRGTVTLDTWAARWLAEHTGLRPRTRELYEWLLDRHILPTLRQMELGRLTPSHIRAWQLSLRSTTGPGVPTDPAALVFRGERGGPLRPHVLQQAWAEARSAARLSHLHLHDLRHAGNTWAATTGASTRELMARMATPAPRPPSATSTPPPSATSPSPTPCPSWPAEHPAHHRAHHRAMDAPWTYRNQPPNATQGHSESAPDQPVRPRASDGNRTRVLSLGTRPEGVRTGLSSAESPGQRVSRSSPDRPGRRRTRGWRGVGAGLGPRRRPSPAGRVPQFRDTISATWRSTGRHEGTGSPDEPSLRRAGASDA